MKTSHHFPALLRLELSPRVEAALRSLEWPDCGCNYPLVSVCLVGKQPGCRERRATGLCGCKPRWLPVCLLEQPFGCAKLQSPRKAALPADEPYAGLPEEPEVSLCGHDLMLMPRCLARGCDQRRKGELCDCARGPAATCPHMGKAEQMRLLAGFLALQRLCPPDVPPHDRWDWTRDLWAWLLWTRQPELYAEKELPGEGVDMSIREVAVKVMDLRQRLGLALRSPLDRYAPIGEAEKKRTWQKQLAFARLLNPQAEAHHDDTAA